MRKNIISLLVLFGLFFGACLSDNPTFLPKFQETDYEDIVINCDKDTSLLTKAGLRITVPANACDCEGGKLTLRTAAVLDNEAMMRHGMHTVAGDGGILESGGMVYVAPLIAGTDCDKPIRVEVPADYINDQMTRFTLTEDGLWEDTGEKVAASDSSVIRIANGRKLFRDSCSACHAMDFRKNSTGPSLGNVHLHREKEWLFAFTRNSQGVIASGDTIAACLWQEWKSVMNPFYLSDSELEDIYQFIANESKRQGIGKDEVEYKDTCTLRVLSQPDSTWMRNSTYILEVLSFGWINVDYFLYNRNPAFSEIAMPRLLIKGELEKDWIIYLSLKERKIVIPFDSVDEEGYHQLLSSYGKKKTPLPFGEKVDIVIIGGNPTKEQARMEYTLRREDNTIHFSF